MSLIKTWIPIGPPDSRGNYSKQRIFCKIVNKEATLTAQSNGIVVCSEWKKCGDHMKKGILRSCPAIIAEERLLKALKMNRGARARKIKFTP